MGVLKLLLMEQSDVDRMLGARDLKEVEKILTELKLTSVIDQGINEGRAILEAVGTWMRREVEQMSPDEADEIFHILWLENDAPVISYFIKQKLNLTSEISKEPLSGMSAFDPDEIKQFIKDGSQGALPMHLTDFITEMLGGEESNAKEVDTAVAAYIANLQLELAGRSGSEHIKSFVSHKIDLNNIRTAVRLNKEEEDEVLPYLLGGGTIPAKELAGDKDKIVSAIEHSGLFMFLPNDLETLFSDPIEFEQLAAHIVATDVSKMWNVPLSIDPLFAFAAITNNQLKLIRTILIAKRSELTPQETKQSLPPFLTASNFA